MKSPNNHIHADSKKRRSCLALLFAAGDVKRYIYKRYIPKYQKIFTFLQKFRIQTVILCYLLFIKLIFLIFMSKKTSADLIKAAKKITKKRPKTVIDHIIEFGFITTEELKETYGYNHPPRAVRDVREEGIPLITYKVTGSDGRKIGAYKFGNPEDIERHKLGGRKTFSKAFKKKLIEKYGEKCAITSEYYEERYLQIDHRVPYEVASDNVGTENDPEKFMLITGTAQRQKSWSCEHCKNLLQEKSIKNCESCYWAYPEQYSHIEMQEIKFLQMVWKGKNEIEEYNKLKSLCGEKGLNLQDCIKDILKSL